MMSHPGVDPQTVRAWLAARSIARGLPGPVADRGGFRVDTESDEEVVRWVFAAVAPGLIELGRAIDLPRHLLKLCGDADALRDALPPRWVIHPPAYFMATDVAPPERELALGYWVEVSRSGAVTEVRVLADDGALAARGYAAETRDAFIYDRIVTDAQHRRKGLGHQLMTRLRAAKQNPAMPEWLVATEEGRALYTTLGWRVVSGYSTASIAEG